MTQNFLNFYDDLFNDVFSIVKADNKPIFSRPMENSGFPFYNIYEKTDGGLVIEFTVAGYNRDSINISVENNNLCVQATHDEKSEDDKKNYKFKSITKRSFKKYFSVPSKYSSEPEATFKDGILSIEFKLDEEKKPKQITIK